jgi:drug/metabolite transporter (DMT)-like permease
MTTVALLSVVAALAASACFGTAAVLQSVGARRILRTGAVDLRLALRLASSLPYMSGFGLDLLGGMLALVAMRRLPVFAVEALIASYVAVTAALAARLLNNPLRPTGWLALGGVAAGVIMLAWSAQGQPAEPAGILARLSVLAAALTLGGLPLALDRMMAQPPPVLAFTGGLVWGLIPLATRMVSEPGVVLGLLSDPAAYTVPIAGALGLLLYTGALQRTSVVSATAMAILGETLVPAAAGLLLLGDQPRPGTGAVALSGFLSTVLACLVLARNATVAQTGRKGVSASDEPFGEESKFNAPQT